MFRTGNDGGHYGGYRHYHIYKAQCRQSGLCVVCPAGYAGRGVRRLPAVRPLRLPHGCLYSRCRGSSRHVFRIEGICGFPCAYRVEAVQPGPLPAAACMGSCTEYVADSFRAGRVAATALYRRLHCIPGIGGVGVSDAAVYKDVRKTVSSLPAGNGQHDLLPGYGNRTSSGSGNGLPPGRCVPALPRRRCSRHTCLVLLRPADVSLL